MADELFLISPVNDNFRRDLEMADTTLLDPTEADCLIQGEWVVLNSAGKAERPAASVRGAMQVFTPKGDFGAQAIGKVAVLQLHDYEAETVVFDDAFAGSVGDALTVTAITVDGVARAGLNAAGSGDFVYGHVTKLPASNGGKLRFQKSLTLVPLP